MLCQSMPWPFSRSRPSAFPSGFPEATRVRRREKTTLKHGGTEALEVCSILPPHPSFLRLLLTSALQGFAGPSKVLAYIRERK